MLEFFSVKLEVRTATLLKERHRHRYFPVIFVKFLRTSILWNISERLLVPLCPTWLECLRGLGHIEYDYRLSLQFVLRLILLRFSNSFAFE